MIKEKNSSFGETFEKALESKTRKIWKGFEIVLFRFGFVTSAKELTKKKL